MAAGDTMKLAVFHSVRGLERLLPLPLLRGLLWPLALAAAVRERRLRRQLVDGMAKLPESWRRKGDIEKLIFRERLRYHLSRFVNFWPDRLQAPPWSDRVRAVGIEAVLNSERPVVLATLHAGRLFLLHYALRSLGLPVALLIDQKEPERSSTKQMKDQLAAGEGPLVFCKRELKAALNHLDSGHCLAVAIDKDSQSMVSLPFGEQQLKLSTGAVRMAQSAGADLAACLVIEIAPWSYEIILGPVVEHLSDVETTMGCLLKDFDGVLARYPEQYGQELLNRISE